MKQVKPGHGKSWLFESQIPDQEGSGIGERGVFSTVDSNPWRLPSASEALGIWAENFCIHLC